MTQQRSLSAPARRARIAALVKSGEVHSQSDLVALLKKSGIEVTQATASRDLEELGALRGRGRDGATIYQLPSDETSGRLISLPAELILSVESSANMAVVRTPPGGAQLLASALDSASSSGHLSSVIGTIAGDDTVLVISRKADGGAGLAKELRGLGTQKKDQLKRKAR
ncbi:MAG: arginine repressor [Actinobacteria bacterium]|nr:arginine repressor [Actinomycetota bacterium]